jgi:hypothetical protein
MNLFTSTQQPAPWVKVRVGNFLLFIWHFIAVSFSISSFAEVDLKETEITQTELCIPEFSVQFS